MKTFKSCSIPKCGILILLTIFLGSSITLFAQTSWQAVGETVSSSEARYISLAMDNSGVPYLAFSEISSLLKANVQKFTGTNWVQVGPSGISEGAVESICLKIDAQNTPYIVYRDFGSSGFGMNTIVKKFDGTSWTELGPAGWSGTGMTTNQTMAINTTGIPYVAYNDGLEAFAVAVRKFDGTNWVNVGEATATQSGADFPSLAIDHQNFAYLVFRDGMNGDKATVKTFHGSSWEVVGGEGFTPDSVGWPQIAIDASDVPYVLFRDCANGNKASVMKFNGSVWIYVGTPGFSAGAISFPSMAIAPNGNILVAFNDAANSNEATVMQYTGSNWAMVGASGISSGAANYISLAITNLNKPYIAFSDNGVLDKAKVMNYDGLSGIAPPEQSKVVVYPNPSFNGLLKIVIPRPSLLKVCDVYGKIVYERQIVTAGNSNFNLSHIPNGIYLLIFTGDDFKASVPVVIAK